MTATLQRIAAIELAAHLSPEVWAAELGLIMDTGMTAVELENAADYLRGNGIRLMTSPKLGYKASYATWRRLERFAGQSVK